MNDGLSNTLFTVGALLGLGLLGETLGQRMRLPRVTIFIGMGVAIGPIGLNILPGFDVSWFDGATTVALTMIGFLLGGKMSRDHVAAYGLPAVRSSFGITVGTFVIVFLGLVLLRLPMEIALVLAGVSLATDPVATVEAIDSRKQENDFTRLLAGIVALDDIWGLLLFGLVMTAVGVVIDGSYQADHVLLGLREMLGGVLLGAILGLPLALLSGRIQEGKPTLLEALAMVFGCAGLALQLEVSYLLAAITMGAVVVQVAGHHERPFHEIAHIEWPFLVLFLILVGASFTPSGLAQFWPYVIAYVLLRIVGRVLSGLVFAPSVQLRSGERSLLGLSLLPQAGVALGTALYAEQHFPQLSSAVISVTVAGTIIFELIGPLATGWCLARYESARGK